MQDINLYKIKKVFFIGIGGIGISALAKMAMSRGMEVLGVNDEESPKTIDPLREAGAIIFYQNELKELPDADMYVFSDAWIYRGPEFIMEARKRNKPVFSYFEALGQFAKEYKVIAIAGTHGKTTTTAMVADILIDAGLDPTVVVGSFVKKFGSNFRKGSGNPASPRSAGQDGARYLVVEADEYNRHFWNFYPYVSVVTNIEADHLDCYKDLTEIQSAFDKFNSQSENKILDYSKYLEKVPKLLVPGVHNRMDASAALAVADFLHIDEEVSRRSLSEFEGTWRRLERKGETKEGTIVYDDYAHHPTEIKASLEGLRELYLKDSKKITVLFQPHLYSRTKALFDDFAKSFKGADQVLLLPIYFARESKDESVSSELLAKAIMEEGENARAFGSFEEAESFVKALNLGSKDVFITMGAGEAYKVADQVFKLV
ncbi:MAG: cyanophycin synthetase [Candidatus Paceibacterota bacterium]|jgi:UDP-N-acetylmuramate--alanine ligase